MERKRRGEEMIKEVKDKKLKAFLRELNSLSKKYNLYIDSSEENPHIRNNKNDIILDNLYFTGKRYIGELYIEPIEYIPKDKKGFCSYCEFFRKATKVYGNPISLYYYSLLRNEYIILNAGQDCPDPETGKKSGCIAPVLCFQAGADPGTGRIVISDRVYASASAGATTASIFWMNPFVP